jgi:hypothetical protein
MSMKRGGEEDLVPVLARISQALFEAMTLVR